MDIVHMQSIRVSAEEKLRGSEWSHSESSATHLLILSTTAIQIGYARRELPNVSFSVFCRLASGSAIATE